MLTLQHLVDRDFRVKNLETMTELNLTLQLAKAASQEHLDDLGTQWLLDAKEFLIKGRRAKSICGKP